MLVSRVWDVLSLACHCWSHRPQVPYAKMGSVPDSIVVRSGGGDPVELGGATTDVCPLWNWFALSL